jgi:glycosyltransferase involved in cell wall biosynthesis
MGAQHTSTRVVALVPCHRTPPAEGLLLRIAAQVDEVVVVDDGMAGLQAAELERTAARVGAEVLHTGHGGKGHAVVAGLRRLDPADRGLAVVVLDADGQHPPEAIPRLLEAAADADLVVGNRFSRPGRVPRVRRVANALASALLSLTTRTRVPDSQCGMRVLTRRALTEVAFPEGGYEAETIHLRRCLRAGVTVRWVDIPAVYNGSPSSFRPVRDSLAVLSACLRDSRAAGPRGPLRPKLR